MRALLSTNHLLTWSGSELTVLELCESLRRRGIDVDVYTNHWEPELRQRFAEISATALDVPENVRVFGYDFAWFQHHTAALFDWTLDAGARERSLLVFAHLSPFEPLEYPGFVVEALAADLVLCNSEETRRAIVDPRLAGKSVAVYPNPAPEVFFERRRDAWPAAPRRVCVVSNHAPPEVREALALSKERGIEATIFGMDGDRSERVTPELLARFDVVITIGRTVQYALASRMPVYCYDYFGGPGYLGAGNVARAEEFNFSGRCCGRKLSAPEIADELVAGYAASVAWVRGVDAERFRLERAVDRVLQVGASANRERAAALASASHDLERERRSSRAYRTAFVVQMFYRRQMLEAQASVAEKDAALAEKDAALLAGQATVERVESELRRATQELSRLAQGQQRIERELTRQRRDLDGVKAQATHMMNLLANRLIKPGVALRKVLRGLIKRLGKSSSRSPSDRADP